MIFDAFERMVAFRYLRARRKEGLISVIAGFSFLSIGLGVATLIVVMAVMNGFRHEFIGRILGINGHLGVQGQGLTLSDFDPLAEALRKMPRVSRAIPTLEGQVMASSPEAAAGAVVRGVRPSDLMARPIITDGLSNDPASFKNGDGVIIGYQLAQKLGLDVGDTITLISPKGTTTAFGTVPRMRGYTIAATMNVGMLEYDSTFIFMPLEAAQVYFKLPGVVSQIEVFLHEPEKVAEAKQQIFTDIERPIRIFDWQQAHARFMDAIQTERNVMFLILTLIIVVAAFNVISSLTMLVADKGRGIAILRTMGATQNSIMRIFLLAGASVGVTGTLLGTLLGIAFAANIEGIRQFIQSVIGKKLFAQEIYYLARLPARIETGEVITIVAIALLLSFAATLYPSWRASKLDPVEALRYE